ncbi:hypothetical protein WR25_20895 isoform A [Diploscapter pachys]|uniref:Neurotransmitter-gated ion-channel ligand-binding domain-containing protein n=4 Tax=Diploscapter pachys TaxID=2018661 RepID=A0A2A2KZU7_9BILA|nr:hypothetical protein WR25_20895 isoform A [Diploscapter pachys]
MCSLLLYLLLLLLSSCPVQCRRRVSQAEKAFENIEGVDWEAEGIFEETSSTASEKKEDKDSDGNSKNETESAENEHKMEVKTTTEKVTTTTDKEKLDEETKKVQELLEGTSDVHNLTKTAEEEQANSLKDKSNRTILWLDAHYKTLDLDLNVTAYPECKAWRKYWMIQKNETEVTKSNETTTEEEFVEDFSDMSVELMEELRKETELVDDKKRLKELGLDSEVLEEHKAVGFVFKEICGDHGRVMWFKTRDEADLIGITDESIICDPYKVELNPAAAKLKELESKINEMIANITEGLMPFPNRTFPTMSPSEATRYITEYPPSYTKEDEGKDLEKQRTMPSNEIRIGETTTKMTKHDVIESHTTESEIQTATATTSEQQQQQQQQTTTSDSSWPQLSTAPPLEPFYEDDALYEYVDDDGKKIEKKKKESVLNETAVALIHEMRDKERETERQKELETNAIMQYDDDVYDYVDMFKRFKEKTGIWRDKRRRHGFEEEHGREKRSAEENKEKASDRGEDESETDWLNQAKHGALTETQAKEVEEVKQREEEEKNATDTKWVEIEGVDTLNPSLLISNIEAIRALGLNVKPEAYIRYQKVGLHLPGICSTFTPAKVDEFKSDEFDSDLDDIGPIGVNLTALEEAGVDLDALAKKLRNATEVDDILQRTANSTKHHGGSYILPVLNKNKYDPFSAPIVFQGSAVVVRFGIYIESMSNFQTTTMDYDMDIYLLMSWRDARLVNRYDQPILVKEEEILEKIWRPDPFFANAKEAEFHEVTFLNFLMRIYSDGLVLYETRVKITPSCNLILCKYPHDKQTCDLMIKSYVKLPELYIDRYEPTTCPSTRKSGEFSCLRAVFRLKRDVGFHIAQTYIPTSLALMFSWVGVWLPEEFMEGRIGVAITVLLTLSTESAGAREHLPSVSYLKVILASAITFI